MNHHEYSHINYLALDILIDAKIDRLPVDIVRIASFFGLTNLINLSINRFENAVIISSRILDKYGYSSDIYYAEYLAAKILSPFVVFKELGVCTLEEFYVLSDLPILIASLRFDLYKNMLDFKKIGKYEIEKRVLKQFIGWINFIR